MFLRLPELKDNMIREKLKRYFSDRGFLEVDLHTSFMEMFYTPQGSSASLVWIVDSDAVGVLTNESYMGYYEKIRATFLQKGFSFVNVLTLFLTDNCVKAREIGEGTAFWIVDERYGRLVIYENQPDDYCGIRIALEQFVSFLTAERIQEAERIKRQQDEMFYQQMEREEAYKRRSSEKVNRNIRELKKYDFKPTVTIGLVVINCIVLVLVNLLGGRIGLAEWTEKGSISWAAVFYGHEYYRLITGMFLHSGIDHIFGNMIILYAAGEYVERSVGHFKFLMVYIGGGIVAGLTSCAYYYQAGQMVRSIGASGAVFAVVGALILYVILNQSNFMEVGALRIVMFSVYALYSGFTNSGVDNAAHVGGLFGGSIIYLLIFGVEHLKKQRE